jgi:23S rRNA (adenine-N6)-dimethyltransferase
MSKKKLRKNFPGQHLMKSKRLAAGIVEMSGVGPEDQVVEIGAGKGALTVHLAQKAKKVIAIENDLSFVKILREELKPHRNVRVIGKDFLEVNLPKKPYSVVSNIPYSITTPILGRLMDQPENPFQNGLLVMEKGAAKRFTSHPSTNPRILAWRMYFDLTMGRTIARYHFAPPPKVDSAVLFIKRKAPPLIPVRFRTLFFKLASYALKHPELPVGEVFRGIFTAPQITHLVKTLKKSRNTPVGRLSDTEWAVVFHTMVRHVPPYRWLK